MPRIESILTHNEKKELAAWVAAKGENFQNYLKYAEERGWKTFTEYYFHRWCQNHRSWIQKAREIHNENIRKLSVFDREKRIEELEGDLTTLNIMIGGVSQATAHTCSDCGKPHLEDPKTVSNLIEQKRKLMEAIAKERNEWGKTTQAEKNSGDISTLRAGALDRLKFLQRPRPIIIEASEQLEIS